MFCKPSSFFGEATPPAHQDSAEGRAIFANQGSKSTEALPKSERFLHVKLSRGMEARAKAERFLRTKAPTTRSDSAEGRAIFANQGSKSTEARPKGERLLHIELPGALRLGSAEG